MMKDKIIEFVRSKDYKYIREVGEGGTGRTVLLEDEIINEYFVCKKYSPYQKEYKELLFGYFKDEIKILHLLNHPNIVRIYNYHLYPEKHTGYILMEYVDGENIDLFLERNPEKLNDIFIQTIEGFTNLERNKILHRDIKPNNILISKEGFVKIIDFGFGKKVNFEEEVNKSISLNWLYSPPADFKDGIYDFQTEIYFIGKLFEEIIKSKNFQNFSYLPLLRTMIENRREQRFSSFFDIQKRITSEQWDEIDFNETERTDYLNFAYCISNDVFSKIEKTAEYITDIDIIIRDLENAYQNSILEENVQNNALIARCFVKGGYKYYTKKYVATWKLQSFLKFLKSVSKEKQKIIVNNLWQRLDVIERYSPYVFDSGDDLPF